MDGDGITLRWIKKRLSGLHLYKMRTIFGKFIREGVTDCLYPHKYTCKEFEEEILESIEPYAANMRSLDNGAANDKFIEGWFNQFMAWMDVEENDYKPVSGRWLFNRPLTKSSKRKWPKQITLNGFIRILKSTYNDWEHVVPKEALDGSYFIEEWFEKYLTYLQIDLS
jgi:hypothetical protein